jgi:hypothetical protein
VEPEENVFAELCKKLKMHKYQASSSDHEMPEKQGNKKKEYRLEAYKNNKHGMDTSWQNPE